MAVPTPGDLEREVKVLIESLGYLIHEFTWGYSIAFSRQVTDEAHVATGRSDPTKATAFDHTQLRSKLQRTVVDIKDMVDTTASDIDRLRRAIEADEHRHGPTFDPLRNPRTATRDDMQGSREARTRRRERGEWAP